MISDLKPYLRPVKFRLVLLFTAFSLLLCCLWQQAYHLPAAMILYHMIVALLVHSFVLFAIAGLYRLLPYRAVAVLTIGAWFFFTGLFYILIFGSVHLWGDIVTIKILGTYLRDFGGFLHSMPFSYSEMVAVTVVFIALPFVIVLLMSGKTESALTDLWDTLTSHRKALLAVVLIAVIASPLLMKGKRFVHKRGEPLMVMLFDHMWGVVDNPLFTPRRIRVGFDDSQLRKQYASDVHTAPRKNVILIIVDALRADHLSAYGYARPTSPFIDGLISSGRAVRVQRCYSTCACTLCGVTSILLSRTWNDCAVNGFNLIGLLHDRHYHTYALIAGAHSEWYNMSKFYSDDCSMFFEGKESRRYYFKDDRVLLEGLDRVRPYADSPAFFYFHMQSAHETGLLLDKYAVYKPFKKSITTKDMNGGAAINEYDDRVIQADDMLRQIFEALNKKGYLRNSMIVITADHGQGLGEHGVSGHVDWLYDPQVSVPLIIYDDSISLYRNLTFARHIDIAPTIADRLGLPVPESWMGRSLLHSGIAPYSYHETGKNELETGVAKYMIVHSIPAGDGEMEDSLSHLYKYIFTADFKHEELYDIVSDPKELNNLCSSQPSALEQMRATAKAEMGVMFGDK